MSKSIKKGTFLTALVVAVLATVLLFGVFNTNTISAHAASPENLTVSEEHDKELKKFARMLSGYDGTLSLNTIGDSTYSSNSMGGEDTFEQDDFECDCIVVVLDAKTSKVNKRHSTNFLVESRLSLSRI